MQSIGDSESWLRRRWAWLQQTLRRGAPLGSDIESSRFLGKWLVLGVVIGIVAGLGSALFQRSIEVATDLFLGHVVGYIPPGPVGEGQPILRDMDRPWLLPIVVGLGGLISGIIVFTFAPEAEGHGTDSAIAAVHHKRGLVRGRIPPIKLLASAITIGSGGSAGREGPAAQISAGIGSQLGQWLKLSAADRRILVAAGIGAGIGAIFRAPLGGAVMAAEILYIHDMEVEALIPSLIASIVGYSVFGMLMGFEPIFGAQPELAFDNPVTLVYYAVLGVICGLGGILYARSFYGIEAVFHRLRIPRILKPALGGVLVGLIGLEVAGALHTGYGWVQISMSAELLTLPLWIVIVLPFAKILATSLSISSGGSGGIFGPGMVIGAMFGAAFWRLAHDTLPQMPDNPAPFVIIGMMALFGGIAHAPLAVMLMVAEMTGNLSLLAPAMVAVALSTALVGDNTIYTSQLPNRASSPAHRIRYSFPLLSSLYARDAMVPFTRTLEPDTPLADVEYRDGKRPESLPVVGDHDRLLGVVPAQELDHVARVGVESTRARAVMDTSVPTIPVDEPLDVALEHLTESERSWLPVVDGPRLVGRLSARNAIAAYRAGLQRGVRRATSLPPNTVLVQQQIGDDSVLVGRELRDAKFPAHTLVVSVTREGETIFPRGTMRLQAGDDLMVMTEPATEDCLRALLAGSDVRERDSMTEDA